MIGGLANFDVLHRGRWGIVELGPLASGARLLALLIVVIVFSGSVQGGAIDRALGRLVSS